MKKIFPIITVLILLSLLGLIFFQFLWLKSAKEIKEQQLDDNITKAVSEAAEKLVQDRSAFPFQKKPDLRFQDKIKMEFFKPSVIQRFSKDDIYEILRTALKKNLLKDIPFEFAVTENSLTGDQVATDNFFKYYLDSAHNIRRIIQLIPPSGSNLENLTKEEFLAVIVPHSRTIVLKEITWFIMGAILFTIIITTAFFLTIRTLLKQKKLQRVCKELLLPPISNVSLGISVSATYTGPPSTLFKLSSSNVSFGPYEPA